MDMPSWMGKPKTITEHNPVPILPITLRGLRMITENCRSGNSRAVWRTTKFQKIVVVARVLESRPDFVLSDNTATVIHPYIRLPYGPDHFYAHHYYRLTFEISPYSSDSLSLLVIRPVSPAEFAIHLSEAIQHELQSQLHERMWENEVEESEESVRDVRSEPVEIRHDARDRIMGAIGNKSRFTHEEIEKEVKCERGELDDLLEELMISGKIGDIGPYYEVFQKES